MDWRWIGMVNGWTVGRQQSGLLCGSMRIERWTCLLDQEQCCYYALPVLLAGIKAATVLVFDY
jgi:hypothetical protein